jgi:hypothetical protein
LSSRYCFIAARQNVEGRLSTGERCVPSSYKTSGARRLGIDRGRWRVPDEFDAPLPDDVLATFEQ